MKRKIFVVGLTHTGKNSLDFALSSLGYTFKHYPHPKRVIEESENYDVLSDTPVTIYMEALDRIYPDARFILTVRNVEEWLESCQEHWRTKKNLTDIQKWNRRVVYGGLDFDEDRFRKLHYAHKEMVKHYFKSRPGKLLIMNICAGDGYEKLCPFLDVPVLNEPFPHRNRK